MAWVDKKQFKALIMGETELRGDTVFCGLNKEIITETQNILRNIQIPNVINLVIDFNDQDMSQLEKMIKTVPKDFLYTIGIIYDNYIATLIFSKILSDNKINKNNINPQFRDIKNLNKALECENFNDYRELMCDSSINIPDFETVQSFFFDSKEKVILHFFLDKVPNQIFQFSVNDYLATRGPSIKRAYTCQDSLLSYMCSNGQRVDSGHDFFEYQGIEQSEEVVKVKKL